MRDFVIMTDSDSELPWQIAEQYGIEVFLMPYTLNDVDYLYDLGKTIDINDFYRQMREGASAKTSARPPQDMADFFREILKTGKDILYLAFSSQLSAQFNSSMLAREEVLQEFPEARITLVDTKSISMGQGMLVVYAAQMKEAGWEMEQIATWVEENKLKMHHCFTVDDLTYLKRGGRLSGAAAFMGTVLDIKPVLGMDRAGRLVPVEKVKGRKKAMKTFLKWIEERGVNLKEQIAVVMQADCMEDGEMLRDMIKERFDFKDIWLLPVGPVIGSHAGPGTLAVLFMGEERKA